MNRNQLENVSEIPLAYESPIKTNFVSIYHEDVILSGIGALLWAIGLGVWTTIFQANRAAWGEFADDISFIIPLGKA